MAWQVLETNPDAELPAEEEPQVGAQAVLRYMCNDQQIEQLLTNNRFTVTDPPTTPNHQPAQPG